MPDLLPVEELRAYLIAEAVVRAWETAGPLPACILNPREGAMPPPAGETIAVTLIRGLDIPGDLWMDRYIEDLTVDVHVLATTQPAAELLQRGIRAKVAEKENVMFGTLRVERTWVWRGIQVQPPRDTDQKLFHVTQSFRIQARNKSLAGLPYAP